MRIERVGVGTHTMSVLYILGRVRKREGGREGEGESEGERGRGRRCALSNHP